ncbi:MAG: hypothetical protein AB1711_03420 [Thermodesulfobacteriota bacterium]
MEQDTKSSEALRDLQVGISAATEAWDTFRAEFDGVARHIEMVIGESVRSLQHRLRASGIQVGSVIQQLQSVSRSIAPVLLKIGSAVRNLPDRTRRLLGTLAQYGWYLDSDMPLSQGLRVAEFVESGKMEDANDLMVDYFENNIEDVCKRISDDFPERRGILEAAFNAHKQRQFALSIPVLLAQADGVCLELTGVQLYAKRGDGQTTKLLDAFKNSAADEDFSSAWLIPLTNVFPIAFGAQQRAGLPDGLYRHAVLHGESTSYDTLVNSCKAISLLSFTSWILAEAGKRQARGINQ